MSPTTPYSGQSSISPPQDGEELIYAPHANTGPLDAYGGGSTLGAPPGYDQVRKLLHHSDEIS